MPPKNPEPAKSTDNAAPPHGDLALVLHHGLQKAALGELTSIIEDSVHPRWVRYVELIGHLRRLGQKLPPYAGYAVTDWPAIVTGFDYVAGPQATVHVQGWADVTAEGSETDSWDRVTVILPVELFGCEQSADLFLRGLRQRAEAIAVAQSRDTEAAERAKLAELYAKYGPPPAAPVFPLDSRDRKPD